MALNFNTVFSYSLSNHIQPKCVDAGCFAPKTAPTLVAVTNTNKIAFKDNESQLHFPDKIRTIAVAPFGQGYDVVVVGTESQIICYDSHLNTTLFQRDVPDGINCMKIGQMGGFEEIIVCGGYCAIWGFDRAGRDVFWTVTGDSVTAMCLADFDSDGQLEIIIGSADHEIRIFKNDLMRAEFIETDAVIALAPLGGARFAYGLQNGTLGIYEGDTRMWRIKSKHNLITVLPFPGVDDITCIWEGGKMDLRSISSGEVLKKEYLNGAIAGVVLSKPRKENEVAQIWVALVDGKIRVFEIGEFKDPEEAALHLLREYGQQKHNLLMELSNYEHDENLSKEEKESENRIPASTQLESLLRVNTETNALELFLRASHDVPIQCIVMFAESLFDGESFVIFPKNDPPNTAVVALAPRKDAPLDIHVKAFLAFGSLGKTTRQMHVFEMMRLVPRFARFAVIKDIGGYKEAKGFVEFRSTQTISRIQDWMLDHFVLPDDYRLDESEGIDNLDLIFVGLKPKTGMILRIKYDAAEQMMKIEHDDMETAGAVVQSMCETWGIKTLESHVYFESEFEELKTLLAELDTAYTTKERLNAEVYEAQNLVKETLIRGEDALHCEQLATARRYYTRMLNANRALKQAVQLRDANQARLVAAVRRLNKLIELASKLRVGVPARDLVAQCRDALADENDVILTKLFEFGASANPAKAILNK